MKITDSFCRRKIIGDKLYFFFNLTTQSPSVSLLQKHSWLQHCWQLPLSRGFVSSTKQSGFK